MRFWPKKMRFVLGLVLVAGPLAVRAEPADPAPTIDIPRVAPAANKRLVTVDDIVSLRRIPALSVSPDGRRFAIAVRQADAKENRYRNGWFVGDFTGGPLRYVGDGGVTRFLILPSGITSGDLEHPQVQWSPDSQWIAYPLKRGDEVQLWRSKADGSVQQRLSNNPSDVVKFAWSQDGRQLFYDVGSTREQRKAQQERRSRSGYRYDEDLQTLHDLTSPHLREVPEKNLTVWTVDVGSGREWVADEKEQAEFKQGLERQAAGTESFLNVLQDAAVPPVANVRGELLWLKRTQARSMKLQLAVSRGKDAKDRMVCTAEACTGIIQKVWWSADGARAMFLRYQGAGRIPGYALYSWSPKSSRVTPVAEFPDDWLREAQAVGGRLLAVREGPAAPTTLISIDEKTGKITTLADVNPEFRNIRIGRVERIEWDAPKLAWNEPGGALAGSYPQRNAGYILYPPDFDPRKKYPVFIDPYAVQSFSDSVGHEQPTQVYAAAGMVVLNSAFPGPEDAMAQFGDDLMSRIYSAELGFPHLTMLSESAFRGLDTLIARGFVDEKRIGIGGVSHGTFIPLYMVQKHDRITALSIAAGSWSPEEYYWPTRKGRENMKKDWRVKPVGAGREFWSQIDIADHIEEIEAPIIMHHALSEAHIALRFMRHLADEGKPYDAYIYTGELHQKWQPAHLQSVQQRNFDWFRFWLQDYEDPDPAKAEQYARWHELRKLQCNNPRSLRNYCGASP